ncbi:SMODS domain-containing nucleotidyltransferase [Roseitranquillus sediminis]|uniref:SMODS domain-containing nucleotidyltransferase n=1 Tax=Roseitranquillus sediminis TaxID=2809051 RepID=UPI001D0CC339|nr:hypothetical protein [Roseitranquillus sediminis]MBM9595738.1 nucleotidyltransferase [Roseitranquillus sediminis]
MSVSSGFNGLVRSLRATEIELQEATLRKEAILSRLQKDFGTTELVRSGSFGHGTSLPIHSDIDYFAVTPREKLKRDSNSSLQGFRSSLLTRFPTTSIVVRSPAVVVPFASSGVRNHEIVPADYIESRSGYRVFDIPDRSGGWMRAAPTGHNGWVNRLNNGLNGRLKELIRLLKCWNYIRSVGLRSFYIEIRTARSMRDEKAIVFSIDFLTVLRKMSSSELAVCRDPIGVTSNIYPCSEAAKASALSKIRSSISYAEKARSYESEGRETMAVQYWDNVFNGQFSRHAT